MGLEEDTCASWHVHRVYHPDEPFGQRHFITADPNGVMIDVIKPIPPSAEFAAQYADEALPR